MKSSTSSRITVLVIIVLTAVSSILSALALTAGHKKGFLENYDVLRINVSGLGQDLLDTADQDNNSGDSSNPLENLWDKASDRAKDIVNDIAGDVVDEVADRLGISDWYSLHILTACYGSFTPNASAPSPGLNITGCRDTQPNHPFNLTEILDQELSLGPLELHLSDLNWPSDIQDMVNIINKLLLALFVLYVLTFALTTLSVLCAPLSVLKPDSRGLALLNTLVSFIAMVCAMASAIVITFVGTIGRDKLNDKADKIGVRAERGTQFLAISWAVAALMLCASLVWIGQVVAASRRRSRYPTTKERW